MTEVWRAQPGLCGSSGVHRSTLLRLALPLFVGFQHEPLSLQPPPTYPQTQPIPHPPTPNQTHRVVQAPSAAAIAAKKMLAIKKKLGIPDEGLLVGYDPAATRTKTGAMPKKAELVEVLPPPRRKLTLDENSLEQAKGRLKRTRTGTLGEDSISSIGSLGKSFSGDSTIDMVLSNASQITLQMQEKLHGGRRGGVSDKKAQKKVKKLLRLTEKDAIVLADLNGEVRREAPPPPLLTQ